jgi:UTP-glucose-1-phosphate uridylyltransferase
MKPTLLILAAGMGSRYGSLKQIEGFGPTGETITDYSIYDAVKAGFGKVVFVISAAMEEEFVSSYIKKFPGSIVIDYVVQTLEKIPSGVSLNPERIKPLGTAHAVLVASEKISEPFAVINADDFYGPASYKLMADYLNTVDEKEFSEYCLAGYKVENTLSKYGSVSRGVCNVNADGFLSDIHERTKIERINNSIVYINEDGLNIEIPQGTLVSMNLFGFLPSFFNHLKAEFESFIARFSDDLKAEIYLPFVVDNLIKAGKARVKVIETPESWFGVTYKEDRPHVQEMINKLIQTKRYPARLFE